MRDGFCVLPLPPSSLTALHPMAPQILDAILTTEANNHLILRSSGELEPRIVGLVRGEYSLLFSKNAFPMTMEAIER